MKKIVSLTLVVILLGGAYFFINKGNEEQTSTTPIVGTEPLTNTTEPTAVALAIQEPTDAFEPLAEIVIVDDQYIISEGSTASYIAQKGWLKKPSEEVVGVSTQVSGNIRFLTVEDGTHQLITNTSIVPDFDSGSSGRDDYVKDLFNGTIDITYNQPYANDLQIIGTYTAVLPLRVSINGVTQNIPTTVTIDYDGETIYLSGSAGFTMSSFGITPPSIIGVYNAADEMTIQFEVEANK